MDPKPQMPQIKAEVNKVDEGKKKATGLLGGLFGGGGSGAAGGLGGLGAGAAAGGGLLATKAGMLALVLMGSAVAGGIGLAGYKMFGPGDADRTGGNLSLFAPKPAQTADANGVAPVSGDGSSASLTMMAQSAAKDKAAEAAADASAAAPTDNTAGDPAKDAAAADAASAASAANAGSGGALNSGSSGGGAAGTMSLAGVKKLGALSGASGGGATTSAGSGSAGKLGENLANAAKNGATSGFSAGGPGAKASSNRGVASGRGRNARSALRSVGVDQQGGRAGSSYAAGRTYDGSATQSGGAIGPNGSAIGMDGAGDGTGAQGKTIPGNAKPTDKEQDPPVPDGKGIVTQFEKNIKMAQMLAMLAMALLFVANKLQDTKLISWGTTTVLIKLIGAAIVAIGIKMAMLAGQILKGVGDEPGQKTPGTVTAIGAVLVLAAGAYVLVAMSSADAEAKEAELAKTKAANEAAASTAQRTAEANATIAESKAAEVTAGKVAATAPVTGAPVTAAPVTAAPVTTAPVTTAPVTTAPVEPAPWELF